ncbi:MAG TPA: phenylalanine--tRNA ligase subunit beta [Nocardioidaceae bacterium]|nr:phenylalanine--tRNA ligase subunit beta [Nocardioidaceae bacterium]
MRAPLSWVREYVDLPADVSAEEVARRLTALGLKLEALEHPGAEMSGPLVVGRVLTMEPETHSNGKTVNWCTVDVSDANGTGEPQGIVCGAHNFAVGDLVVVVLPGGVLPGPHGAIEIGARKTYGHLSAGMICSARELGLGEDQAGIVVLPSDAGKPGDDAFALLHLRDDVIEMEINPDRAYALSIRGVAREVATAFDVDFRDPAERSVPTPNAAGYPVRVEDPAGCPVFVTRTVTGFDPSAPSPAWMARRVQLAGMRSISLAVDVTNYVMLELGNPIHGYDADRLSGPIVVRRARQGERLTTLDGTDRALATEDLLITDDSGPIGLAGVMGGQTTELSGDTSTVVIEAAHFDAVSIFRTARRHKLPTEGAKRWERGVDPLLPAYAADRVAELLVAHGGGRIEEGVTYVGAPPAPIEITAPADLAARVSGVPVEGGTAVDALRRVGCTVRADDDVLTVLPPAWRPDLTDPYDLVEEVVRLVGYDQVPSVLPAAPAGRGLTRDQRLRRRVGFALAGLGLVEVKSFPFVGPEDLDALGLAEDDVRRATIALANPLSTEQPALTTTLLPGLLRAAARNVGRGAADVHLFETAAVFVPSPDGAKAPILGVDWRPDQADLDKLLAAIPEQPHILSVVMTGRLQPSGWWGAGRAAMWSDAVQVVREVARVLGVDVEVSAASRAPWHPGRCAQMRIGDLVIGHAGELHPGVCARYDVPPRTCAVEVDLGALLAAAPDVVRAASFSSYPVAKEDVALLVDASLPAAAVGTTLREGAGELCESVRLFDLYTGDQVPEGKKSLAFALRFRAPDRTLTEAETGAARDAAVALAVERHGAVQRA